ncbi:MAG TPA: VIT1/CCC1 transporter family protein [Candidatus Binatia bacterium]|nr:VIT1/CCC1 transporter family protein [Dongiaceae bacterium]HXJ87646.1 VIT1/CCC1 transporter family protein [Candidatus Binatia bacterium]
MNTNSAVTDWSLNPQERKRILTILERNWQAEIRGHETYAALAERENDPQRSIAFRTLADAEQRHADLWAARHSALGGSQLIYAGPRTGEADNLPNRIGGINMALRRLELDETQDIAKYAKQLEDIGDQPSIVILSQVLKDEREHYQILSNLIRNRRPLPAFPPDQPRKALDELLAARQAGSPKAAGWIGDAIYGINDGLGAIFGIVSGVSGATLGNSKVVVLAGTVGMIASALSMGAGAYLAAKSEREIYEAEYAREREAVEYNEPEAREVLSLSYQVRGLSEEDANRFVDQVARDKTLLVQALARERLSTTEEGLRKPWTSAISGALSTAVGAMIPIVPFFFLTGYPAVIVAAVVSLLAHFAVGAAKSLITIRSWWSSGLEMTFVGAIEGVVTYVIGIVLGRIGGAGF